MYDMHFCLLKVVIFIVCALRDLCFTISCTKKHELFFQVEFNPAKEISPEPAFFLRMSYLLFPLFFLNLLDVLTFFIFLGV